MKGTKRSKPYSARPVTSYFQSASQIASSSQSVAAQESDTNVGGSGIVLEHTIPPEQQQVSPHIVVNMEDANTSTHEEGPTVELNPDDIVADPGLSFWKIQRVFVLRIILLCQIWKMKYQLEAVRGAVVAS
jgi:hypothetical protein